MDPQVESEWSQRPIYGGVLIGGASTRMGRPKPLLALAGETFVDHVIAALQDRVDRTVLLGDGPVPPAWRGLTQLADALDVTGPLAGMLAGLRWKRGVCWIIVACDLPKLRPEALDWLIAQRRADRWAILPTVTKGRVEPLLAAYEPEALDLLERRAQRGVAAPRDLAGEPLVHTPTPPASLRECWVNINTPDEYRRLRREVEES